MKDRLKKQTEVYLLPIAAVIPSPYQARTNFSDDEIKKLAVSILQNGLLQPISVRKIVDGKYELIAGERRLRACKLAGMETIPAIIFLTNDDTTAALSLLENIQREQLNPFEQGYALKELLKLWNCTQEDAARRLGMSQSALANKIRIIALTQSQQEACIKNNLTERHARAVLALEAEEERTQVLQNVIKYKLNVVQTEQLVAKRLAQRPHKKPIILVKDVRLFLNTINKAIQTMIAGGVPATSTKKEKDGYIEYTVRIPTKQP